MLGRALLICPVLEPGAKSRRCYLPEGCDWYDFHTEAKFSGGRWVDVDASLSRIPVFVRSGSILPVGPVKQHSMEKSDEPVELRVYAGADGAFRLYDDAGDGYGYEEGAYGVKTLTWDDRAGRLETAFSGDPRYEIKNTTLRIIGGNP
jgi:alpha-D-xyloside xylohydrolase